MKHTNLDHEITGAYYEPTPSWKKYAVAILAVLVTIALYDLFIGIDVEGLILK